MKTHSGDQKMFDGAEVIIAGKKYKVEYQVNRTHMIWLTSPRKATLFLRRTTRDNDAYSVVSWKSGKPLVNKHGEPIRVILMGNMLEDITGKNI